MGYGSQALREDRLQGEHLLLAVSEDDPRLIRQLLPLGSSKLHLNPRVRIAVRNPLKEASVNGHPDVVPGFRIFQAGSSRLRAGPGEFGSFQTNTTSSLNSSIGECASLHDHQNIHWVLLTF